MAAAREGAMAVPPLESGPRVAGRWSRRAVGYLLVAPFMLMFAAMLIVPLGYAFYLSLFQDRLIGGTTFVGLDHYRAALTDPLLRDGVLRMVWFGLIQIPLMLGLALFFALALDSGRLALARFCRLGMFLPYAVPSVVAVLMWGYLYGPDFGPFAQLARHLGASPPDFLSSDWMLLSLGNIVCWEYIGYNMIVLFAALQTVPSDVIEAARTDGAGPFLTAWTIKIPAIRGALLLTFVFSVIGTLQLFNEPHILTRLAPAVISVSYTPNVYAYQLAFTNQELNYSAAVSFTLGFAMVLLSSLVILVASRRVQGR